MDRIGALARCIDAAREYGERSLHPLGTPRIERGQQVRKRHAMILRNLLTGSFLAMALLTQGAIALSCCGERTSVTILARGPAGLRIEGKGSEVSVEEDASTLLFSVPLAPLETGISLRDRHLREILEAEKYPSATLRVSRSALRFPGKHDPAEGTADAELTLHGQSRPVKVHYRAELGTGDITRVRGSFQLDMRDFDITAPSYLGITLAPKVEVRVEVAVKGA
jgi:polyisoprenoid-binding protein YceI